MNLLALVQRLVELCQGGADGVCCLTHGRKTCAQQNHARGRRERCLGGASTCQLVGNLERRANEFVEGGALLLRQSHAPLDLTDWPSAQCRGKVLADVGPRVGVVFAGDATKLYRLSATAFSDVTRLAGGAYACPADGRWCFLQFGQNVLAFYGFDAPQVFNIETDTNFSALGGSPPTALYACIAGDFVMTGNQPTARARVQWSAINNAASWATSQTAQAKPTISDVQHRVDLLYHQAEQASEQYNQIHVQLNQMRGDVQSLKADQARQQAHEHKRQSPPHGGRSEEAKHPQEPVQAHFDHHARHQG